MIPWFQFQQIPVGPFHIQVWGSFVALGLLFGTWVAARRAKMRGFATADVWDFAFWAFLSAFFGARIFHVFFYDFGHYLANPVDAINPALPGFSVIGGFIGAAFAFWIYTRRRKLDFLKFADICIFGLPFGLMIGRLGCFMIHDHPGVPCISNPLCMMYPDGVARHDHGLYLSFLGLLVSIVFLIFGRKPRLPGFFLALYMMMYSAVRFFLDFYRAADARYFSLTPTQWLLIPLGIFGVYLLLRIQGTENSMTKGLSVQSSVP